MGLYYALVRSGLVPDLILRSANNLILASADIDGFVSNTEGTAGQPEATAILLGITVVNAYDTAATDKVIDGPFSFGDVVLGDYTIAVRAEVNEVPDTTVLPTYLGDQPFWEDATTLFLRQDTSGLAIRMVAFPDTAALDGEGEVGGSVDLITLDTGDVAGRLERIEARRRLAKVGVSLSRSRISMRVAADTFDLFAYTYTDSVGIYRFEEIPDGNYRIRFEIPGFPMDTASDIFLTINVEEDMGIIEANAVADEATGLIKVETTFITGVFRRKISILQVYPNPADQQLFVDLGDLKNYEFRFTIIDIQGRKMMEIDQDDVYRNGSRIEIDVGRLSPGIYIMNLLERDIEMRIGKLVIRR